MFRRALLSSSRHARRPSRLAMNRPPPSFSPKPIGATTSVEWPRADHSPPSITTRSFAGKKNKKKGGGGKGGGDEGVTLMYYWDGGNPGPAEYEDEDEVIRFKKPPSMNDIHKKMEMEYGFPPDATYQYYMFGKWHELKNATQLTVGTKGSKGPVWIRMVEEEEEEMMTEEEMMSEDYGEDYDEDYNEDYGDEESPKIFGMKGTIRDLAKKLRDANVSALPTEDGGVPTLKKGDGTTMSTREYVLLEAKKDKPLQDLLLREVGGLDHIVQCLHFDFVLENDEGDNVIPEAEDLLPI